MKIYKVENLKAHRENEVIEGNEANQSAHGEALALLVPFHQPCCPCPGQESGSNGSAPLRRTLWPCQLERYTLLSKDI